MVTKQNLENMYRLGFYNSAVGGRALPEEEQKLLGQATVLAVDYVSLQRYVDNPENGVLDI